MCFLSKMWSHEALTYKTNTVNFNIEALSVTSSKLLKITLTNRQAYISQDTQK